MSAMELADYEAIILCIYRPPDSNFQFFLKTLELILHKIQLNKKNSCVWGLEFKFYGGK
jgi:hypothetical protein